MPTDDARTLAARLVEALFTNGAGQRADRLVLVHGADERDLGGWGRGPITDRLAEALEAYAAKRVAEAQRENEGVIMGLLDALAGRTTPLKDIRAAAPRAPGGATE